MFQNSKFFSSTVDLERLPTLLKTRAAWPPCAVPEAKNGLAAVGSLIQELIQIHPGLMVELSSLISLGRSPRTNYHINNLEVHTSNAKHKLLLKALI